jgi:hypothetical protein
MKAYRRWFHDVTNALIDMATVCRISSSAGTSILKERYYSKYLYMLYTTKWFLHSVSAKCIFQTECVYLVYDHGHYVLIIHFTVICFFLSSLCCLRYAVIRLFEVLR